jgi:hypothetical protein
MPAEEAPRPWLDERQMPDAGTIGAHAARRNEDDSMFGCQEVPEAGKTRLIRTKLVVMRRN